MKLATLIDSSSGNQNPKPNSSRDGKLLVVSRDNAHAVIAANFHPELRSLREAVESWAQSKSKLESLYDKLNEGALSDAFKVDNRSLHSPFPRSFQWVDGSAFLHHVKLVRQARGAPIPDSLFTVPLMYQGGSDSFLAPTEDIPQIDFSHGTDFEGEVAVVTDDVPMGIEASEALKHVILLLMVNDVSLRGLIPEELAAGFGFFQSKPSSAFGPFAVTPDELGENYKEGRIHLPLNVDFNGQFFGRANAGEMHFHFGQLIAHAARTRPLAAGTIIGSGTVSNEDPAVGSSCLVEKRMLEKINEGVMKTPFMKVGDSVRLEMKSPAGNSIFGVIEQKVAKYPAT